MDNRLNAIGERLSGIERKLATESKVFVKEAIKSAYNESKQPGGRKFKALKRPTGKLPVIGLRDYYTYTPVGNTLKITADRKPYAVFHHTGTKFMPPRTPWPKKIPEQWKETVGRRLMRVVMRAGFGK